MDYSSLARSYNALSYTYQLRELLGGFFQTDKYAHLSKYELVKTINDTVFKHYESEQILKYLLAREIINKKYVAAFEVKVKSSRTDFLVINGDTKAYEIKSKLDNLNRLEKQVSDYGDVFEYNTVVLDKSHLLGSLKIIPDYYGVWYFEHGKKHIYRAAQLSPKIDSAEQLNILNKKELLKSFHTINIAQILSTYDYDSINLALKLALKERYLKRWNFIQTNWNEILPIDLQFFFNSNIRPDIIYEL